VLIGTAALSLALIATRAGPVSEWQWLAIGATTTLIAVLYTIASEWMNTSFRQGWQYSQLMPTIELHGQVIGVSPLAQWFVLPPLALFLARRSTRGVSRLAAAPHAEMHGSHRE
jgi:hypothetical protein